MGGGIKHAFSAREDLIDECDLAEAFHMFVPDEATKALAVGLEAPLGWVVQCGVGFDVVIAGGDQKVAVCVGRIAQHLLVELHRQFGENLVASGAK